MILLYNLGYLLSMIHHYKVKIKQLNFNQFIFFINLDTSDLTRQLEKKNDIYNYYFSFLKLIAVWNKVKSNHSSYKLIFYLNYFSFMSHILTMEFTTPNKSYNNLVRNYNVLKLSLKQASVLFVFFYFFIL